MADNYYDNTSPNGNLLCGMCELHDNIMLPENPVGYFKYKVQGRALDRIDENKDNELLNLNPSTCDVSYLGLFAYEYNVKRHPSWSDEEYRARILLKKYPTNSIGDYEYLFNLIGNINNDNETGEEIVILTSENSFLFSDKNRDNQLMSDKNEDKDLLTENVVRIIVKIPFNFNKDLLEFIKQFLPFDFDIV